MNGDHISTSCEPDLPFLYEHFMDIWIAWAVCDSKVHKIGVM